MQRKATTFLVFLVLFGSISLSAMDKDMDKEEHTSSTSDNNNLNFYLSNKVGKMLTKLINVYNESKVKRDKVNMSHTPSLRRSSFLTEEKIDALKKYFSEKK